MKVATGTIVDATIINAPSSTKNADKARDPEMHQTRKGNQWYFGMKAHIGVDSKTEDHPRGGGDCGQCRRLHGAARSPARRGDAGLGRSGLSRPERGDPRARAEGAGLHQSPLSSRGVVDEAERAKNRTKSKVRAKVEHAFGVIKRVFGFVKVRYRGLEKNAHRLFVTCALANLFMARHHLLQRQRA